MKRQDMEEVMRLRERLEQLYRRLAQAHAILDERPGEAAAILSSGVTELERLRDDARLLTEGEAGGASPGIGVA